MTCFYCLAQCTSVGADEEVSLTETERIRLLADYIQETECFHLFYLLFSTVIILFIFILFHISVHLSKVQVC